MHLLDSLHPAVRLWTVRLLGDAQLLSPELAHRLDEFAEQESDLNVSNWPAVQLASLLIKRCP